MKAGAAKAGLATSSSTRSAASASPPRKPASDTKKPGDDTSAEKKKGAGLASSAADGERRRLSALGSESGLEAPDGAGAMETLAKSQRGGIVSKFAAKSKVGLIPMNPNKVNQDCHFEHDAFCKDSSQYFFGIMDGHGYQGKEVSDLVKKRLPGHLSRDMNLRQDPASAISKAVLRTNSELMRSSLDTTFSGSTLVTCLLRGSTVYTANVGDCRALVGRQHGGSWEVEPLSEDHKPDRPDETRRILEHDGRVEPFRGPDGEPIGPPRLWLKHQDAPGLAMSRSLGDSVAASVGCIPDPEIKVHALHMEDKFIVMASDGIWEFITSEECIRIVAPFYERGDVNAATEELVKEANERWRKAEEVVDDCTCIIIFLALGSS